VILLANVTFKFYLFCIMMSYLDTVFLLYFIEMSANEITNRYFGITVIGRRLS